MACRFNISPDTRLDWSFWVQFPRDSEPATRVGLAKRALVALPGDLNGDHSRRDEAGLRAIGNHDALSKVARVIAPRLDATVSAARVLTGSREYRTPR